MNSADLPRLYRAALTYHPEIGTFRGWRGAWRVYYCFGKWNSWPGGIYVDSCADAGKMLVMDVPRQLRRNTFVNPTKLLREVFAQRRIDGLNEFYVREMNL